MSANESDNADGEAIKRMFNRADKGAAARAGLSESALARIWRGQIELRQQKLNTPSTGGPSRKR